MDTYTIAAAIAFFGSVVLSVVTITFQVILGWFRARRAIKATNSDVIAFTLAERIAAKEYARMPGVWDGGPTNTRLVQGLYDPGSRRLIDARALASDKTPTDPELVRLHDVGNGLVIYP